MIKRLLIFTSLFLYTTLAMSDDFNSGGIFNKGQLICNSAGANCIKAKQLNIGTPVDNGDGSVTVGVSTDGTIYGWTRSTNTVYLTNSADNVGIGTSAPSQTLDLYSGLTTGTANPKIQLTGRGPATNYTVVRDQAGDLGATFNIITLNAKNNTSTTNLINLGAFANVTQGSAPAMNYFFAGNAYNDTTARFYPNKNSTFDGNVGIGSTSPQAKLDVEGNVYFGTLGTGLVRSTAGVITADATAYATSSDLTSGLAGKQATLNGTGIVRMAGTSVTYDNTVYQTNNSQWTTSGTNIYSTLAGSVGIGTTSPMGKLDVDDNIYAITFRDKNLLGFYRKNTLVTDYSGLNRISATSAIDAYVPTYYAPATGLSFSSWFNMSDTTTIGATDILCLHENRGATWGSYSYLIIGGDNVPQANGFSQFMWIVRADSAGNLVYVWRSSKTYNDALWHHIVGRIDASGSKVYIDGVYDPGGFWTTIGNAGSNPFGNWYLADLYIGGVTAATPALYWEYIYTSSTNIRVNIYKSSAGGGANKVATGVGALGTYIPLTTSGGSGITGSAWLNGTTSVSVGASNTIAFNYGKSDTAIYPAQLTAAVKGIVGNTKITLDETRFWNRSLSDYELLNLYDSYFYYPNLATANNITGLGFGANYSTAYFMNAPTTTAQYPNGPPKGLIYSRTIPSDGPGGNIVDVQITRDSYGSDTTVATFGVTSNYGINTFGMYAFSNTDGTDAYAIKTRASNIQDDGAGAEIALYAPKGDVWTAADGYGLLLGAALPVNGVAGNASIRYDGTDMVINPAVSGTGKVRFNDAGSWTTTAPTGAVRYLKIKADDGNTYLIKGQLP